MIDDRIGDVVGPDRSGDDDPRLPSAPDVAARLAASGCVAPEEEAAELLAVTATATQLDALVVGRTGGEPLAWLVGSVVFCGLRVTVRRGVYVPRPQSEALARRAVERLGGDGVAVDLCTGAGAVARVLQAAAPSATVVATDIDPVAVRCARENGVDALLGDLDEPLPPTLLGAVDVMTAVVPYVPTDHLRFLPRDVTTFEPRRALDGGDAGLAVLSRVVACGRRWLGPGGWLLLELGGNQAAAVAAAMQADAFTEISVKVDDEGDDRLIEGRRPI